MASVNVKKDSGWKYGYLADPKNKNNITCSFCSKEAKGGIYRLKQHLVGGFRNIIACQKCPEHVKVEIREFMQKKKDEKDDLNLLPDYDDVVWKIRKKMKLP